MANENSRFKTRKEREKEKTPENGYFVLPTFEELQEIEQTAKEDAAKAVSSEKSLAFFQKPSNWNDGYQFGDVTKSVLGTLGDIGVGTVKGVMKMGEGIGDAAQYGAAAIADAVGADDKAEAIRRNAQQEKVASAFSGVDDYLDRYSVLGRTSDAAAESLGQIGGILATGGLAGAAGLGAVGATALTSGVMGVSSFGSGTGEAYAAGAEEGEAEAYGAIAGAADALSEMIFGGLGKGINALGISRGLSSADDMLAKALSSKIKNTLAKNTVQLGVKAGAEGLEEVLAGTMQAAGKKMTYMSEKDFADIIADENLLEQFVVGALASGVAQAPGYVSASRAGVDLVSDGGAEGAGDAEDTKASTNPHIEEIERTGRDVGADEGTVALARDVSSLTGRGVRFFSEAENDGYINNGFWDPDSNTININVKSKNPSAQILSHELTHSIENTDSYLQLRSVIFDRMKRDGMDLDAEYRKKEMLYNDAGYRLRDEGEIAHEIIAEQIEKRYLTDEASIRSLVSENRTLGQRIREWFDSLLAKMGNAEAKERDYVRQVRDLYAKALGEGKTGDGMSEAQYHISKHFGREIDIALNPKLTGTNQVKARDYTPKILVDHGVKNKPMLMTRNHVRSTILTEDEAKVRGLKTGKGINYHGLGKKLLMKTIDNLDKPNEIYKKNDDTYLIVTRTKDQSGNEIIVPVRIDGTGVYNDVYIEENHILSAYGKKNLDAYLNRNGFELIYKKSDTTLNKGVQYSNVGDTADNSISQVDENVNREFSVSEEQQTDDNDIRYSISPSFETEIDAWDQKTEGFSFVVGNTSEALQKAGISKKQIRMDATKIKKLLDKHSGMSIEIIKQIPQLLEEPVIVIDSKQDDNSKIVMGELYDDNGKLVTAVLLLAPTSRGGNVLDMIKISSAEGRGHIGSLFRKEDGTPVEVRYVDEKRIRDWLNVNRLQLPLRNLGLDSDNSISQVDENVNREFSVSKVVEETKDLIAVHNLNADKLMKSLALGGMPMPSIAIAKAEGGHENFGDISLVFDKSTIDPRASAENKVYSGDAWTPTYPSVEYKVNDAVERRVRDKYYDLAKRIGYDEARAMYRYAENLEDSLNRDGGEDAMIQRLYDDTGMMQIYLQDVGRGKVEPIMHEVTEKMTEGQAFFSEYLIEVLGEELISGIKAPDGVIPSVHRRAYMEAHGAEIREAYKQMRIELYGDSETEANQKAKEVKTMDLLKLLNDAYRYIHNGGTTVKTVTDTNATNEAIRAAADDGYREWIDSLFRGVQEKSGIRNQQDTFTKSGNRRSWEATHYEETLENVVRAMKESGEKGVGSFGGGNIFGASTQDFTSIEDIKKSAGRLQNLTEDEFQEIKRGFRERFSELAGSLPKNKDSFSAMDDAANMLVEAVVKYKTKKGIDGYLRRESQGWANYSPDVTEELISLVNDIRAMPTQYFEAKPQRAVSFDEVAAFVIPRNADIKVKQELLNRGYSIAEYDPDVPGDRAKVLNGMDKYKFSISKSDDPESKRVTVEADRIAEERAKNKENLKHQKYVDWWSKNLALQDARDKTDRQLKRERLKGEQKLFDEKQREEKRIADEQYKTWWQKALSDEDRKRELEARRDDIRESKEMHEKFEQERRMRKEREKKTADEVRRDEIKNGEIRTIAQRLDANLENAQSELDDLWAMRENTAEEYRSDLALMQEIYQSQKNKNTEKANTLERRIARIEARAKDEDAAYQKRIADVETRIEKIREEIRNGDSAKERNAMRRDLHEGIIANIKNNFSKRGLDLDKVLAKAKDLSTFATVDNTPQRVMEKSLGYQAGQALSDLTVNRVAENETAGIRWLNQYTSRDGVIAGLAKKYNIKPGSKESAAAQMYAEGFYVNEYDEIVEYGDRELAADFPDAQVQKNIKGLARDPVIRQIYDQTLDAINASRARNAYPEIQKLDNYYLHFRAMDDTFSRLGVPFNPNDIRAKDLPTDLSGVTADLKPGQPYFASAQHRKGKRTSFDLLGGLEKYLTSAKNQIYHIDDIQTLRALRNYIADMYGQGNGLQGLDDMDEDAVQERIKQVYDSHLSTLAKFLNEEANIIAGKTSLIDRGLEGVIGRRGITFLNDVNRQVGANMVGWNVSSSLTNVLPVVQAFAKTNKLAFVKGFAQTVQNRLASITGQGDGFAETSDVIVRRKGADRYHRTPWQKASDTGYLLMGMVDDISTEIIARAKYNELTAKGMDAETANRETDKWVSRLMGDRSLGQMPQIFNSKMLGMVTKFQLEVRNQIDAQFYDTIKEAQADYAEIGDKAKRNAKIAAKVTATFAELAIAQHLFGAVFESIAGYNPAFDVIEVLAKVIGLDDDEESEDTVLDNIEQGVLALIEDLPYSSVLMDGGRVPISAAMPIGDIIKGEDQYGNEVNRLRTAAEALPYYVLPGGYGQIKKTAQGLSMFTGNKPVTGSYTDSGNLRFPVEATPGNVAQAAVFGQWANEGARDYFNNKRTPANERQTKGYAESGLEWGEYTKYRNQISKLEKDADKLALIDALDVDAKAKEALYRYLVASAKKDDDGNIIGSSEDERLAALYDVGLGFDDYADAKLKQSELNADESLSANQRAARFLAWVSQNGYTDEQAEVIGEQFSFASGFRAEPASYKKMVSAGVTTDNAVTITDALSGAERDIDKINAIWGTGIIGAQLDAAIKAVVSETQYERYRIIIDANVPLEAYTWVLDNADIDGNGSISNEERELALSRLALDPSDLSALWLATGGSEKSNPYKGSAFGIKMPEINIPQIDMPELDFNIPHFDFEFNFGGNKT